jgi:pimeloyl-ACP methyl ester carboxylesterase
VNVDLEDGRTLRAYDSGASEEFAIVWHHGSPQTGRPLEPLLEAAATRGIRLVSYGRPSYGRSTPNPGRDVGSAARDVEQVADALGVERFAVMGASGGGPHALACAALLPDRVSGVACLGGIAPYTEDFDWAALQDTWTSLGQDAGKAGAAGLDGLIDDQVAFVSPWGFDVEQIEAPVLIAHGGEDRVVPPAHAHYLAGQCPESELWLRRRDGHVSILDACPLAMDWLSQRR